MQRKLFGNIQWLSMAAASVAAATLASAPAPVEACGGFFCSATNPVNQAAEQIIFSQNGDGTVTAVIQIMYEGPSQKFAWVLPVPGTPKVAVSSAQAFVALKQATNPQYNLTTTFDPSCPQAKTLRRALRSGPPAWRKTRGRAASRCKLRARLAPTTTTSYRSTRSSRTAPRSRSIG